MGTTNSTPMKQEFDMSSGEAVDTTERFFGLENFGNTCYCNSVLQALYFCPPLRLRLQENVKNSGIESDVSSNDNAPQLPTESILYQLSDLFKTIRSMKKVSGCVAPTDFLKVLRERNELFRGNMQQDAHEFFNFIINDMADTLSGLSKNEPECHEGKEKTWIHDLFEGILTNETRCICCESVTQRDESFMDLSLDIEQNSSVNACLRNFSKTETLTSRNKFFCETCCALQEAEKRMRLRRLPRVLTLHLKRFKYLEQLQNFSKLSHRVVFPLELRIPNMSKETEADAEKYLYKLFAVVVHIGRGPNHGHYVSIVKSNDSWILFDDDLVEVVNESVLHHVFGLSNNTGGSTNTGYLLFYDSGNQSHAKD